jgi:hypothetical protein
MAPTEFHEALGALGIAQQRVAALFGVGPRSVRRWQYGERRVPCGVGIVFRLLAIGAVTVEQVEQAAAPISAPTNGAAPESGAPKYEGADTIEDDEQPAPLDSEASADLAEAAPEQSAPLPLEPALEPVTTAEKVAALNSKVCHWPCGDPRHSDFHFCGESTTAPPYCDEHRAVAYLAPPSRWVRSPPAHVYTRPAGLRGRAELSTRDPAQEAPSIEIELKEGVRLIDAIAALRGEIQAVRNQISAIRAAPLPASDQRDLIESYVVRRRLSPRLSPSARAVNSASDRNNNASLRRHQRLVSCSNNVGQARSADA